MPHFLAIDSTGKTASKSRGKAYCYQACKTANTRVGIYAPGASLVEIMRDIVAVVPLAEYDSCTLTSMMNQLGISYSSWLEGKREEYAMRINIFARTMHHHRIDTTLVLGGDPSLWPYNNDLENDYRFIQQDIIAIATHYGIRCYTGMEHMFSGGLGLFRDRVDHMGHFVSEARDDAVNWLCAILDLPLEGSIPRALPLTTPPPPLRMPPHLPTSRPQTAVTNARMPPTQTTCDTLTFREIASSDCGSVCDDPAHNIDLRGADADDNPSGWFKCECTECGRGDKMCNHRNHVTLRMFNLPRFPEVRKLLRGDCIENLTTRQQRNTMRRDDTFGGRRRTTGEHKKKTADTPNETPRAETQRCSVTYPRTRPIAKRCAGPSRQMTGSTELEATAEPLMINGWNATDYSKGLSKASLYRDWIAQERIRESSWTTSGSSCGSGSEEKGDRWNKTDEQHNVNGAKPDESTKYTVGTIIEGQSSRGVRRPRPELGATQPPPKRLHRAQDATGVPAVKDLSDAKARIGPKGDGKGHSMGHPLAGPSRPIHTFPLPEPERKEMQDKIRYPEEACRDTGACWDYDSNSRISLPSSTSSHMRWRDCGYANTFPTRWWLKHMVYSNGKKITKITSNSKSSEQIYLGSRKKTVAPPDETRRAEVRRIDITFPRTRPIAKRLVGPSQQMTRSTEPEATADPPIIDGWNTSAYSKGPGKASQHHDWPAREMTRESVGRRMTVQMDLVAR